MTTVYIQSERRTQASIKIIKKSKKSKKNLNLTTKINIIVVKTASEAAHWTFMLLAAGLFC